MTTWLNSAKVAHNCAVISRLELELLLRKTVLAGPTVTASDRLTDGVHAGDDVEVLEPKELRDEVKAEFA